jgi:16S rRNA (cytosine967-C5)-methyltransferase
VDHGRSDRGSLVEGLAARQAAAALLVAVLDHRQGLDRLTEAESAPKAWTLLDPRDRGLALAIVKTALRHHRSVGSCLDALMERPLPPDARMARAILHVAAVQILHLRVPPSAAVNLAVEAMRADPQARRFAGLANAVLRRLARHGGTDTGSMPLEAPDWLIAALSADYGEDTARAMLDAQRHEAPLDLSVRSDPGHWAATLGGMVLPTGTVRIAHGSTPIPELPGFDEGAWWVQDAAAALPVRLLGPVKGLRVADICAAPGGKTAQLALAGAHVTAIDISQQRLARLSRNLARLGLEADILAADARTHSPAEPYDAVLLDAPCSSTGTLRRHPDVAWTKTPDDIANLVRVQRQLLDAAFAIVRPGGQVVFANCSLLQAEGERLIANWLADNRHASIDRVEPGRDGPVAAFATADGAVRTTPLSLKVTSPDTGEADPAMSGMDGFFAARIIRTR